MNTVTSIQPAVTADSFSPPDQPLATDPGPLASQPQCAQFARVLGRLRAAGRTTAGTRIAA